MINTNQKNLALTRRKKRIQKRVKGTTQRPRLTIHLSNTSVSAQIIDDGTGQTLVTSMSRKLKSTPLSAVAAKVGADIARKAKKEKIATVVFDRNGRQYHTRLNALAEAARKEGLEF